jgi:hypothetical protein
MQIAMAASDTPLASTALQQLTDTRKRHVRDSREVFHVLSWKKVGGSEGIHIVVDDFGN